MKPVDLIVDALAAYRLTRLVTLDTITETPRRAIVREAFLRECWLPYSEDEQVEGWDEWMSTPPSSYPAAEFVSHVREAGKVPIPKAADLITCRWCAGVWVAFGVIAARYFAPSLWDPVARALAVSAAAALVAGLEQ